MRPLMTETQIEAYIGACEASGYTGPGYHAACDLRRITKAHAATVAEIDDLDRWLGRVAGYAGGSETDGRASRRAYIRNAVTRLGGIAAALGVPVQDLATDDTPFRALADEWARLSAENDQLHTEIKERGVSFHKWTAHGIEVERAAVVAYLRRAPRVPDRPCDRCDHGTEDRWRCWCDCHDQLHGAADRIEAGDHREGK